MLRYIFSFLLAFALLTSCARQPSETETFFVNWLKAHGETNIVVDGGGVGKAGNPTRLKASQYGSEKHQDGRYVVETEFRIRLPSKEEIIEFVAGMGDSEEKAADDSLLNFTLSTFHVVYKSFLNAADPHQTIEKITINGAAHELFMGDIYTRGPESSEKLDLEPMRAQIKAAVVALPLDKRTHWIKIVYYQQGGRARTVAVTLDNQDHEALTTSIKALKWPISDKYYVMKQFIVIK